MRPDILNDLEEMLDEGHEQFFCDTTLLSTIGELERMAAVFTPESGTADDRRIGMLRRILNNEADRRNDTRPAQDTEPS